MNGQGFSEFRGSWPLLLVCTLGLAVGNSALLFYNLGIFAVPLRQAVGLTSTQLGIATLIATLAISVLAPLAGAAVDRVGARIVVVASALGLAAGFFLMSVAITSAAAYICLQALTAALSVGTGPVSYTRVIGGAFNRSRGLALGIALTGIGLSAAVTPILLARTIAAYDWMAGYRLLALLALFGAGLGVLALPRTHGIGAGPVRAETEGLAPARAMRRPAFWMLFAAFALQALAYGSLLPHFVPLLIGSGIDAIRAAAFASGIGVAVIASRLITGWLTDRLFAPWIAAAICLLCAGGCFLLLLDPRHFAFLAALAIGCAVGGEVDLIGFCTARYFGMRAYGRLYGILYAGFLTASGVGPLLMGIVHDTTGSYRPALIVIIAGLLAAGLIFLLIPSYPAADPADVAQE